MLVFSFLRLFKCPPNYPLTIHVYTFWIKMDFNVLCERFTHDAGRTYHSHAPSLHGDSRLVGILTYGRVLRSDLATCWWWTLMRYTYNKTCEFWRRGAHQLVLRGPARVWAGPSAALPWRLFRFFPRCGACIGNVAGPPESGCWGWACSMRDSIGAHWRPRCLPWHSG